MKRFCTFLLFVFFSASAAYAVIPAEQQKIDSMLNSLANSDVTFIRNGEEHDGKWAADHLRQKQAEIQTSGETINTAQDFIKKVATSSRESKKPYIVKLANGKMEPAPKYFQDLLMHLNHKR
jgi:hypothetical protein